MKYTKKTLAALLNGRQYREEITDAEEADAKTCGLVVIFGYSDDNMEIRGAIHDEVGCYGDKIFRIDAKGVIPSFDDLDSSNEEEMADYFKRRGGGKEVESKWSYNGYSWVYGTKIPHEIFEIKEDGEKYCQGIVFNLSELAK